MDIFLDGLQIFSNSKQNILNDAIYFINRLEYILIDDEKHSDDSSSAQNLSNYHLPLPHLQYCGLPNSTDWNFKSNKQPIIHSSLWNAIFPETFLIKYEINYECQFLLWNLRHALTIKVPLHRVKGISKLFLTLANNSITISK